MNNVIRPNKKGILTFLKVKKVKTTDSDGWGLEHVACQWPISSEPFQSEMCKCVNKKKEGAVGCCLEMHFGPVECYLMIIYSKSRKLNGTNS